MSSTESTSAAAQDSRALKGKRGWRRLVNAMRYSVDGFRAAWRQEDAFRQEVLLAAVMIPVAVVLPVTVVERLLLIGTVCLVLIVELLNTAIEATIDRQSYDINPLAKTAKDVGSAAVTLALALAVLTWLSIVSPYAAGALAGT
jgi:diacylglycerol kinase (ATP)